METSYKKAQQYLMRMEKSDFRSEALNYKKAICFICLENYTEAQKQFAMAFHELQYGFRLWALSNQPDLLIDTSVLAGKADHAGQIRADLYNYAEARKKKSYLDYYSLILLNLLAGHEDMAINTWIKELLAKPAIKEGYEMGNIFQAIVDSNQNRFDVSLRNLLNLHKKAARYGSLRDTPEGLISLSALSLAYCAVKKNLYIDYTDSNFPIQYINFLLA